MKELFVEITFALAVVTVVGLSTANPTDPIDSFIPDIELTPMTTVQGNSLLSPIAAARHRVDFIPLGALPLHASITG